MHTSYAPDKIDLDALELMCDELKCELINVLENDDEYKDEMYDRANDQIKHIAATLDAMME